MTTFDTIYKRSEDAAWRTIDGAAVVVTPHDGMIHQLNETATYIWKELETPRSAREIADLLRSQFDVDETTSLAHSVEFLQLLAGKLIIIETE